jgi:hypothetical protein
MVDEKQIKSLLKKHFEVDGEVSINPATGLVSVSGNVRLITSVRVDALPVSFEDVGGNFDCRHNQLSSLKGSPVHVGGGFFVNYNQLASLEHAPADVGTSFWCSYNKNLPLLRLLTYQKNVVFGAPIQLKQILKKHAGLGRRGAIQAAREIMHEGEKIQQEQGLARNPFEAHARW